MIASGRTSLTISGSISGSGFAIAKMIGLSFMDSTIFWETIPPFERPKKISESTRASSNVLNFVLIA